MKVYLVQVTLGQNFVDLSVTANSDAGAIEAAKAMVKSDAALKLFIHRFANYIV